MVGRSSPALLLLALCAAALLVPGHAQTQSTAANDDAGSKSSGGGVEAVRNPVPRPSGGPITITASVPSGGTVKLVYVVNYGPELTLSMAASSGGNYSATIPASDAAPGNMVRWAVAASGGQGGNTLRDPPALPAGKPGRQYYGTIVEDTSDRSSLPVFDLYCKDEKAPYDTKTKKAPGDTSNKTATPGCSLFFEDNFYDSIVVRRHGQASLAWPKPNFRVDSGKQGKLFKIPGRSYGFKEFNLDGGETKMTQHFPVCNSFMRQTLAWEALRQMGVDSLLTFQSQVRLNGKYYGKFAFSEVWNEDSLASNGYTVKPEPGVFFKSNSGEYANLRWDIPPDQVQFYYTDEFKKDCSNNAKLVELGKGLAGGGSLPRSKFLFESIDLPKTINQLAAQAVLLNEDRCTKNFYTYQDPQSQQWAMIPWDLKSSFASDRGLGGTPAPDYCILACEQWNSPLYCDHNHPQDIANVKTPWALITTQYNFPSAAAGRKLLGQGGVAGGGPATPFRTQRALLQGAGSASGAGTTAGTAINGAASPGLSLPANSSIPSDYDADQTKKGPTPNAAPGTFNYLTDAILSVPRTRAMYVRRVRTLMDQFIGTGQLQSIVTTEYNKIRDEAKRDVAKWGNPGDPDRGYKALITEALPIRKDQLYNTYSTKGSTPVIPDAQPGGTNLVTIGDVAAGSDGYVQMVNGDGAAVDVSGWKLSGGGVTFTFIPGTVIAGKDSLYVAAGSINTFKNRRSGPSGRQGLFIVGPLNGAPDTKAISITS